MNRYAVASYRAQPRGFTLIEILVVIAIVAVLASIAVPTMGDYLRRSRLVEAQARLSDHRVRMEQFYLDSRRYDDGAGNCGFPAPAAGANDTFALSCTATGSGYVVTASGLAGKAAAGFIFTIDDANVHRTIGVPDGWIPNATCWVVRRDGSCV
jgi:type IV pilus assembly protein PilE